MALQSVIGDLNRRKMEEGRRKKEEGIRKKEEGYKGFAQDEKKEESPSASRAGEKKEKGKRKKTYIASFLASRILRLIWINL